ncbi:putative WD repeat-containing protein [Spathaspora sp. JA1]|nr:putative WD repeat-containing protein [Spathaspora sp. JA1]
MRAQCLFNWSSLAANDNWVLKLQHLPQANSFICSNSNGTITSYSLDKPTQTPIFQVNKAHESSINSLIKLNNNDNHSIATCSTDGIKLWDLRSSTPIVQLSQGRNSSFLSLGFNNDNLLAGGTELMGVDAELHIWDLRNTKEVVKSFIDSHHDDITSVEFHPTISNYLMSGSTDGYVNVYDLNQPDEDEALHQVINYSSVHSCHFVTPSRISVLSHMESLVFHDLNDTNYDELKEPNFTDLGDVRQVWPDNEYVVDVDPRGFVAFGANSQRKLTIFPFNPIKESFDVDKPVWFPDAHGEEVVRDVCVIPNSKNVLTCGEDGQIRLWELPYQLETFSISTISDDDIVVDKEEREPEKKKSKKDKDKKEKKDKKDKDKKKKKDKHKKKHEVRFKPY